MSSLTPMTSGGAVRHIKRSTRSMWSDLPEDLLAMIYSRLSTPTPHNRLSFAATCRSWRATAVSLRHTAPPALPWLIYGSNKLKKRCLYIPQDNGGTLSISLQTEVVGKRFAGFYDGGWVAMTIEGNRHLMIVNLCSGVEVPLSEKQRRGPICGHDDGLCTVRKIIFSESPASGGCILAAFINSCSLALCRIGCPDSGWTTKYLGRTTPMDITFCNRELYGLMPQNELAMFGIGGQENGVPMFTSDSWPLTAPDFNAHLAYPRYIVDLCGKIALVVKMDDTGETMFKVFELVHDAMSLYICKWAEVMSLGDYALFLQRTWSKAVFVPTGGRGVVQRNYIRVNDGVYSMSSAKNGGYMYHMQPMNDGIELIRGSPGCCVAGGPQGGLWVLPPNF